MEFHLQQFLNDFHQLELHHTNLNREKTQKSFQRVPLRPLGPLVIYSLEDPADPSRRQIKGVQHFLCGEAFETYFFGFISPCKSVGASVSSFKGKHS
jgi:hypothetical protein